MTAARQQSGCRREIEKALRETRSETQKAPASTGGSLAGDTLLGCGKPCEQKHNHVGDKYRVESAQHGHCRALSSLRSHNIVDAFNNLSTRTFASLMPYDLAAVAAAFTIAFSNLIAPQAIRHLGPVVFNCCRLAAALLALLCLVATRGGWTVPSSGQLLALAASSALGIIIADSCFYAAMARLGPRRTSVIYTSWAAFAALLGYVILGETLSPVKVAGIGCVVGGVWLAILFRQPSGKPAVSEETQGSLLAGVLFGLLSALCAAGAVLIARPVMAQGLDPAMATIIRATVGLPGLLVLSRLPGFRAPEPVTAAIVLRSAASGLLGMGVGMTLVLFALSGQPVGIVSTLSSTTPVVILPLLWLTTGARPAPTAWLGAACAVIGAAAIASGY
jgi:drug/metabolite transporter (DMT)-like permease